MILNNVKTLKKIIKNPKAREMIEQALYIRGVLIFEC